MYHKTSNFLLVLGILITAAGIYITTFDLLIGVLGISMGVWNIYKANRLRKDPVPYMIKKHEEAKEEQLKELFEEAENDRKQ